MPVLAANVRWSERSASSELRQKILRHVPHGRDLIRAGPMGQQLSFVIPDSKRASRVLQHDHKKSRGFGNEFISGAVQGRLVRRVKKNFSKPILGFFCGGRGLPARSPARAASPSP